MYSYFNRGIPSNDAGNIFPYKDHSMFASALWGYADYTSNLKLDQFYLFSGNDTLPGYQFKYNYDSKMSPRSDGYHVDHWGYYSSTADKFQSSSDTNYSTPVGTKTPVFSDAVKCSLSGIVLPTGGSVSFEYELNATAAAGKGGIRVKRIVTADSMQQSNIMMKEYKYVDGSGTSSGYVVNDPIYNYYYKEHYDPSSGNPNHPQNLDLPYDLVTHYLDNTIAPLTTMNYMVNSSQPLNAVKYLHGSSVGYTRVEEISGTSTRNIGKKVYYFGGGIWMHDSLKGGVFPFVNRPDVDFAEGLLTKVEDYSSTGALLKRTVNDYAIYPSYENASQFTSSKVGLSEHATTNPIYITKYAYPISGKVFPVKSSTTEYYTNGASISQYMETAYDTAKMVARTVRTVNSDGDTIKTKFYYPFDFSISGTLATLNTKGIIYDPVRIETWKNNDKVMSSSITTTTATFGMIKQDASYVQTTTDPVTAASWGSFDPAVLIPNTQYFTKTMSLDRYDALGNLLQATSKGTSSCTLWDYDYRIPVAQVINAGYDDVAYTSFETDNLGGWDMVSGSLSYYDADGFTGNSGVGISPSTILSRQLNPSKTYILSVWTKNAPIAVKTYINGVNGTTTNVLNPTASESHRGWQLCTFKVQGNSVEIKGITPTLGNYTYMDELRLYPEGAMMTTSTYNTLYGITSSCDAASKAAYYEYDKFGRLLYTRDVDGNILQYQEYKNQEIQN